MPTQKRSGRRFIVEINHPTFGWVRPSGQQSGSTTLTNEQVDVTNKGEMPWRQLMNCGTRSNTISCNGIVFFPQDHSAAMFDYINDRALDGAFIEARIVSNLFEVSYQGLYQISTFERSGEYNGVEQWSISLESSGTLSRLNLPLFDAVQPRDGFVHGWSMRVLRQGYADAGGKCLRVRRSSDNVEQDIPFLNGYIDVSNLSSFLGGSVGRVVTFYDQAPPIQYYPNGSPVALSNLSQPAAAQQPYITDLSGNLFLNPSGIPQIGFGWDQPTMGANPGIFLYGPSDDWGVSVGNVQVVFAGSFNKGIDTNEGGTIIGRSGGAFAFDSQIDISGKFYRFVSDGPDDPKDYSQTWPQPSQISMIGVTSNNFKRAMMINAGTVVSTSIANQNWGAGEIRIGGSGTRSFKGWISEGYVYLEDEQYVTPEYTAEAVRIVQKNQAQAFGVSFP